MSGGDRRREVVDATLEALRHTVGRDEHMPFLKRLVEGQIGPGDLRGDRRGGLRGCERSRSGFRLGRADRDDQTRCAMKGPDAHKVLCAAVHSTPVHRPLTLSPDSMARWSLAG